MIGVRSVCRRRLCKVQSLLLIMSAGALGWSTRILGRLVAMLVVTSRCSADESRVGAAADGLVVVVGENFSLL